MKSSYVARRNTRIADPSTVGGARRPSYSWEAGDMHHPGDTSLNVRAKIIDPTNQSLIGGVFATVAGQAITKDGFFYQDASGAVNPSSIVAADENTLELVFPRVLEDGDLNIYGSWVSLVASGGLQASDAILEYFADTGSGGMAVEPSETDSL